MDGGCETGRGGDERANDESTTGDDVGEVGGTGTILLSSSWSSWSSSVFGSR